MPSRVSKLKRSGNESEKKSRYQNNDDPIRVIYVTQFNKCPFRVTSKSLKTYFEKVGSVERVDYICKSSHKFAFVTYRNSEDAQKVLADSTFQQNMKIRKADPWHQPKNNEKKSKPKVDHNSSDNFGLLILNDDCLLYLFSFLNPVDAANLAETDDRIRLVSQFHFKKYSYFQSECVTVQETHMISRVYEHVGPWITSLKFDPLLSGSISTDKMFGMFAKYCSNVETLNISNIEYHKKPNAFVKTFCSKIKRIEMYNCNIGDSTIADLFSGPTSSLEYLMICDCDFITGKCFSKLTNLKTLKIRSCPNLNDHQLHKSLRSSRFLTEFEISRCDAMFDYSYVKYLENLNTLTFDMFDYPYGQIGKLLELNQLKKLKIICFESVQMDSFLLKLGQKDILEELHINYLQIGERTIEAFESFKKLKILNLILPSNKIKEMFFKRLSIVLPQLKSLNYYDPEITMDDIMLIIKQLKHLEYFDISSYGCVTMTEIVEIIELLKTNLNRPLLHVIVTENSFWPNSNWKKDPIMLGNKQILEINVKTTSDDDISDESDESDNFYAPFHESDDSDSDGETMMAIALVHMVLGGRLHNNINNINLFNNVD